MKFKHWLRFLATSDTTWNGQFQALRPLLLARNDIQPLVVDVGANDGFYSSNSYPFIRRGWKAVLIEPHPVAFAAASRRHACNPKVTLLNTACGAAAAKLPLALCEGNSGGSLSMLVVGSRPLRPDRVVSNTIVVKVERLEIILERLNAPQAFGLLSIDTEGFDFEVLQGLNLKRFRPSVVITENGTTDQGKFAHLAEHGYQLHRRLPADTIWTRVN